ncbi:histidine phosphatase family protein, partial [Candidatus Woesearchaeota archaeon]|nr:histidine phosphatase family protein [Candidatus Woesearchaeota archaeon]
FMRLIIIRHGETDWNSLELCQGHANISLNEAGLKQAEQVAQRLKDEKIDRAFASDLERAVETADLILAHHPATPVEYHQQLRERNYGVFEGKTYSEFRRGIVDSGDLPHLFRPDSGESLLDVQKRALDFYESLLQRCVSETILVVAHGGVVQSLLLGIDNQPFAEETRKRYRHDNTGYSILTVNFSGNPHYEVFNCADHLKK